VNLVEDLQQRLLQTEQRIELLTRFSQLFEYNPSEGKQTKLAKSILDEDFDEISTEEDEEEEEEADEKEKEEEEKVQNQKEENKSHHREQNLDKTSMEIDLPNPSLSTLPFKGKKSKRRSKVMKRVLLMSIEDPNFPEKEIRVGPDFPVTALTVGKDLSQIRLFPLLNPSVSVNPKKINALVTWKYVGLLLSFYLTLFFLFFFFPNSFLFSLPLPSFFFFF